MGRAQDIPGPPSDGPSFSLVLDITQAAINATRAAIREPIQVNSNQTIDSAATAITRPLEKGQSKSLSKKESSKVEADDQEQHAPNKTSRHQNLSTQGKPKAHYRTPAPREHDHITAKSKKKAKG
jgi:hypothetical protein